jgi:uncharacterized protein
MAYHVNRTDREITNPEALEEIIKRNRIAVIGMCRKNEPYVVTLSYGYESNEKMIYFHCAKKGQKIDFLKDNPNVCITIIDDHGKKEDECSHSYRSVVIKGKMVFVDNEQEKINAVRILINHFEKNPGKLMEKVETNSGLWQRTQMLKIRLNRVTGKEKTLKQE